MNHYNCIYMYVNKVNNKKYVGQAKDFNKRHKHHISKSANKYPIDRVFNKYGEEIFDIIILKENLQSQCLLNLYECYYIEKYNCLAKNGKGYNLASGGHNGNALAGKTEEEINEWKQKRSGENHPMYGKHHSEETKRKMSEARSGENNPMYGKHHSEETIQKRKDTVTKNETFKGKNNPMYGKHHSEEAKQKISEAMKGKCCGENHPNSIKIKQEDKQGNLIKIWNGSGEAERETGINHGNIIQCCKWYACGESLEEWYKTHKTKPLKSAGGFIWKYVEED